MEPQERQEKILEMLSSGSEINILELSKLFNVTDETIRRDLRKLENSNKIIRYYGGAKLVYSRKNEVPIEIRQDIFKESKNKIGKLAAKYIKNGDVIYIDASTTAKYIIKNIPRSQKNTIITNSNTILAYASSFDNLKIIILGGEYNKLTNSFLSLETLHIAKTYYADKAFVSCRGINFSCLTDPIIEQSKLRNIMLNNANESYIIIDSTKFNLTSLYKITETENIKNIITDKKPIPQWMNLFTKLNINVDY